MKWNRHSRGLTLIEILVVVVILGILGAIVLPKFSNASATARENMLAEDLRVFRTQLTVFKGQHLNVAPGYPGLNSSVTPTEDAFIAYLTGASNRDGNLGAIGTIGYYGPYFSSIPMNPLNAKNTVQIIADGDALPVTGDNSHGWVYQPSTLTLRADSPDTDTNGKAYYDY